MKPIITPNLVAFATVLAVTTISTAAAGSSAPAAAERIENLLRRTYQYVAMYPDLDKMKTWQAPKAQKLSQ
jgi:hypothetical protein